MAMLLAHMIDQISRELGERQDPRLDALRIANEAGRYLFAMHPWRWRERPVVTLTTTPSQTWVDLPGDFGELIGVQMVNNTLAVIEVVALDRLQWLRAYPIVTMLRYYVAVAWPATEDLGSSLTLVPGGPRLEIYPDPSDAISFTINYRAGWVELTDPADQAYVPPAYELVLSRLCRAIAVMYRDNDGAKLTEVESDPMLARLKQADARSQQTQGKLAGGILPPMTTVPNRPFWNPVPTP